MKLIKFYHQGDSVFMEMLVKNTEEMNNLRNNIKLLTEIRHDDIWLTDITR